MRDMSTQIAPTEGCRELYHARVRRTKQRELGKEGEAYGAVVPLEARRARVRDQRHAVRPRDVHDFDDVVGARRVHHDGRV